MQQGTLARGRAPLGDFGKRGVRQKREEESQTQKARTEWGWFRARWGQRWGLQPHFLPPCFPGVVHKASFLCGQHGKGLVWGVVGPRREGSV